MLGESEPFLSCLEQVSRAARVNRPVLVVGERGTGKELVAARIHYLSDRWDQPRVTVNCAAFAPDLLESEIFGHERGAFTGADRTKMGRFELAHGGSLFMDELAQSTKPLQEKLLRILEYGEFERVGGTDTMKLDVRVIAATHEDLPTLVTNGEFRADLLDRLSFEVITIPPLRERADDIPLLALVFARRMAVELGLKDPPEFTQDAMNTLLSYSWPGNIRELKNAVERSVFRLNGGLIDQVFLDPFASPYRVSPPEKPTDLEGKMDLNKQLADTERRWILEALTRNRYHQRKTAESLSLSYHQFRRCLARLGIDPKSDQ
ncbi:MAG: sigma 54-interacting transcriptional regulator [Acidobacteria bacterium]|nr:sigma 54-interacting transcriptional regulator [Acidobacteriota bacterium]